MKIELDIKKDLKKFDSTLVLSAYKAIEVAAITVKVKHHIFWNQTR